MKTPDPSKDESGAPGTGAVIIGQTPAKLHTVTAEVLVRLLTGEHLTSLDAVRDASTTRLGAVVHYLTERYGWEIDRKDKATGCKDGRVAWVGEYWLDPAVIAQAMTPANADWCAKVRAARLKLRAKSAQAAKQAERANAAARRARSAYSSQRGQWGLFEGGAAP